MKTHEITKEEALNLYKNGSDETKQFLEEKFGKEIFEEKDYMRIKSFEDACADQKLNPDKILPYNRKTKDTEEQVSNAYRMLRIIAKSIQGDWKADFNNSEEYKYWPYFKWQESRFGFWSSDYNFTFTFTGVGSRLCFPTAEMSEYFGKQFIEIHNVVLTK